MTSEFIWFFIHCLKERFFFYYNFSIVFDYFSYDETLMHQFAIATQSDTVSQSNRKSIHLHLLHSHPFHPYAFRPIYSPPAVVRRRSTISSLPCTPTFSMRMPSRICNALCQVDERTFLFTNNEIAHNNNEHGHFCPRLLYERYDGLNCHETFDGNWTRSDVWCSGGHT